MEVIEFKPGMEFKACPPKFQTTIVLVHIDHVLPSVANPERKLLVYRVWNVYRRAWHENICTDVEMMIHIRTAELEAKYQAAAKEQKRIAISKSDFIELANSRGYKFPGWNDPPTMPEPPLSEPEKS